MRSGLRSPRRTAHFTSDSACDGELTDFGFSFAAKNALCTETATVLLETRVCARLRLGFRIQGVAVNSGISSGASKVRHFASICDFFACFLDPWMTHSFYCVLSRAGRARVAIDLALHVN